MNFCDSKSAFNELWDGILVVRMDEVDIPVSASAKIINLQAWWRRHDPARLDRQVRHDRRSARTYDPVPASPPNQIQRVRLSCCDTTSSA